MTDFPEQLSKAPDLLAQFKRDPVYEGSPDYVFRANDLKTTSEILNWAHHKKMPVTFAASQTSMTGSGVADKGIALSLNKMDRILDIGLDRQTNEPFVLTEPGILLGDLKKQVWEAGYFYPPDPTSFKEARVGGTVATNATGSDTFKYGPTRLYVEELEILTADGRFQILKRSGPAKIEHPKNRAGYFLNAEPIDEIIGSEGTLALITKIKLKLLKNKGRNLFYLVLPFSSFKNSLEGVLKILKFKNQPRALELIGPGSANYFRSCPECPEELKNEDCFLYIKDEYDDALDLEKKIDLWFQDLKTLYQDIENISFLDRVFAATTPKQHEALHACRHYIPLKVNEEFFPYTKLGGGKIGTDWWVPTHHLLDMMLTTFEEAKTLEIPFLVFGHIGNGHPHWDFLCKNSEEYKKAQSFVNKQCERAALYGGGVAGEHGIGKLKRHLMLIQHSPKVVKQMADLKQKWDPHWILGQGNLFVMP